MTDKEQNELADLRALREMLANMKTHGEQDVAQFDDVDADAADSEALESAIVKAREIGKRYMKRWRVHLTETISYSMKVEARTDWEAQEFARDIWANSLDPTLDFDGIGEGVEVASCEEMTP